MRTTPPTSGSPAVHPESSSSTSTPKHGADPREVMGELDLEDHPHVVWTGEASEPDAKHPNSLEGVRGAHLYFRGEHPTAKTRIAGVEIRGAVPTCSRHHRGTHPASSTRARCRRSTSCPSCRNRSGASGQAVRERRRTAGPRPNPHGVQHDTLVSFAGWMRRRGAVAEEIIAAFR